MPAHIEVKIGKVTYPSPGLAQVVVELGIQPKQVALSTAAAMFTQLPEVSSAGSLKWDEGTIALYLTNAHTTSLPPALLEKLKQVCANVLRLELGYDVQV